MRRVFILLLALLLPIQFTWATAAVYCGHEASAAVSGFTSAATTASAAATTGTVAFTSAAARHFGHHEHEHHAEPKKDAPKPLSVDLDCGVCHAGASSVTGVGLKWQAPAAAASIHASAATVAVTSTIARAPDRPQWPVLA